METLGITQANSIIQKIHEFLGNFMRTYNLQENHVDADYSWKCIFVESEF